MQINKADQIMNVIDILNERGFVEQTTHEKELKEFFENGPVTCYTGFDPTADSLHIGHLIPIMALSHMQKHGHRPIALVGGGTGLVGDPSGKTEMRKMLTPDLVNENVKGIKKQLSRFIDFNDDKALLVNNADWLTKIKYIEFLRDIGRHFSVNRMLKAESYRLRLDSDEGLSFIEFNYMLLQAFDFLQLFNEYGCRLQMGGSDQWGNIVAGIELIRRTRHETAFGVTFSLITTSTGAKMGKTAKGAVWLDPERTSPYEFYQYWINSDDKDVARFLALYTFLPMDEVRAVEKLQGAELNSAKAVLAFEATQLAHGKQEAIKAYESASSMFGKRVVPKDVLPSSTIPRDEINATTPFPSANLSGTINATLPSLSANLSSTIPHSFMDREELEKGVPVFKLYHMVGLAKSGGAARRLIDQGGAYINGKRIEGFDTLVTVDDIHDMEILLRAGKKKYHKIKINA
jgi:tyrosyl-tRNA synthetase